jgi:hypothetical protein
MADVIDMRNVSEMSNNFCDFHLISEYLAREVMRAIMVLIGARTVVSTLAGGVRGTNEAYADGSGTNAGFNFPWGEAVDASGNVFVIDINNQRIRKVTAGGGMLIKPVMFAVLLIRCIIGWAQPYYHHPLRPLPISDFFMFCLNHFFSFPPIAMKCH